MTDPFEARRRGTRRLRITTAALGAAAAVGTGALAWSLADTEAASAATSDQSSNDSGTTSSSDSHFTAPSRSLGSSYGSPHASSGGS